ncbi:hypothetical protein MT325_M288L [Paramecium bursaria chlorella virus MT325]|uniref:Uncharacterized protein M288L n=1 Tax=Paramecium bursaria Chlorella virus MT325 TaxID=346932 RepID=A7IU18_PBCVM|nr:hypothetical protein MT325_M288L [Paramecium bursaria chlorella virus MT325]
MINDTTQQKDYSMYMLAHKDINITLNNEDIIFEHDINKFKCVYIGITNNIYRRSKEHARKELILRDENKRQPKLDKHIKKNGWKSYNLLILKTDLTRQEAFDLEIYTIKKYNTFELGLNSTPGGDGGICGINHHRAQAVNIYNNTTKEIKSFLWMGEAADFLGINSTYVSQVANSKLQSEQAWSVRQNAWFQIKRAYDNSDFIENMPIPSEKISNSKKGSLNPQFGKTGVLSTNYGKTGELNPNYGKKSIEHSIRMSGTGNSMFGRTGVKAPSSKPVCVFGNVYPSSQCASNELRICFKQKTKNFISNWLSYKRHSEDVFKISKPFYDYVINFDIKNVNNELYKTWSAFYFE